MARRAKPWWWSQIGEWCVTIRGKRHRLGKVKKAAYDEFHKLMGKPQKRTSGDSVVAVLDDFLTWCYENRAQRTADRYKDFCQAFCDKHGQYPVDSLTTAHVTSWLNKNPQWNSTTKRNAITALMRGFNWACKNRGLEKNPIRGMEKPEAKKRIVVVSTDQFAEVLEHAKGPFRDLLIFCFDCGCRPEEVKKLEARHLQMDKQRAVLASDEAKKGIQRAIYFATPRSLKIVKRLAKENPIGPLFLNRSGNPWTAGAVKCQFDRLEKKIGRRLTHYAMRHSFITRKLIAGVDSHVVAALSGHKNTAMIDATYSHIAEDHAFMLKEAKRS